MLSSGAAICKNRAMAPQAPPTQTKHTAERYRQVLERHSGQFPYIKAEKRKTK
jgi:hypothetical protein